MADMANNTFEQHKLERELTWIEMWEDLEKQGIRPVELWEGGAPGYIPTERQAPPRIAVFPAMPSSGAEQPRGLIIICAGGGFNFKSRQEGKPVASISKSGASTPLSWTIAVSPIPPWMPAPTASGRCAGCGTTQRS